MRAKRVAVVHYWMFSVRGGEKVIAEILRCFPAADLFLHCAERTAVEQILPTNFSGEVHYTGVSSFPFSARLYKAYVAFMPFFSEQIDLSDYDLVISSESGPAKNLIIDPDSTHICYCHSPMRYIWDMYHFYMRDLSPPARMFWRMATHYMRLADRLSSFSVDYFIANSTYVQRRINKIYRREAAVIFPPVDVERFEACNLKKAGDEYYLYLGQLETYKRFDLAIAACAALNLRLKVVGNGKNLERLKREAPPNIEFIGRASDDEVVTLLSGARALLFPGVEDFGIVPIEAFASGTPVIAQRAGGALDYIKEGHNGLFFDGSLESLCEELERVSSGRVTFDCEAIRSTALAFSSERFRAEFIDFVREKT